MSGANSKINPHDVNFPPYTPPSSLGHELGILFAFFTLSIITMALYWYFWQAAQRRNIAKEAARREALAERARAWEAEKRQNANSHIDTNNRVNGGSADPTSVTWNNTAAQRFGGARNGTSAAEFGSGDTENNMTV
ncbi:hypothetical protein VTO42DRAFT_7325 [Malbranchea cinnamomea]